MVSFESTLLSSKGTGEITTWGLDKGIRVSAGFQVSSLACIQPYGQFLKGPLIGAPFHFARYPNGRGKSMPEFARNWRQRPSTYGRRAQTTLRFSWKRVASSADLRFKVRGFLALNPRMHIEGKWDAIDPQSVPPLLFLRIDPRRTLNGVHGLKAADRVQQVRATILL
jgi:hypothetical protein